MNIISKTLLDDEIISQNIKSSKVFREKIIIKLLKQNNKDIKLLIDIFELRNIELYYIEKINITINNNTQRQNLRRDEIKLLNEFLNLQYQKKELKKQEKKKENKQESLF